MNNMFQASHGACIAFFIHYAGIQRNVPVPVRQPAQSHTLVFRVRFRNPCTGFCRI